MQAVWMAHSLLVLAIAVCLVVWSLKIDLRLLVLLAWHRIVDASQAYWNSLEHTPASQAARSSDHSRYLGTWVLGYLGFAKLCVQGCGKNRQGCWLLALLEVAAAALLEWGSNFELHAFPQM